MLVRCPECNKKVSSEALSCPSCGYRIKEKFNKDDKSNKQDNFKPKKKTILG